MKAIMLLLVCAVLLTAPFVFAETPQHIFLSYTGTTTQMRVTWTTAAAYTAQNVYWWEPNGAQHVYAVAASATKTFVRPNSAGTQYITSAIIGATTQWQPYLNYTYQIRLIDTDSTTWSAIWDARGLPAKNTPSTIGIYGDLGAYGPILTSTNANGLMAYARAHRFDLIVHNGDLAYNLGSSNGATGEAFLNNFQSVAARVPYLVSPGNHEYFTDTSNSMTYYTNYFQSQTALGQASGSTQPLLWYSYDFSYAHFVIINTEVYCEDTTKIEAMWNWLDSKLSTLRTNDPTGWIFVVGHRQMYLGTTGAFDSYLQRFGLTCTDPKVFSTCNVKQPCYTNDPTKCGFAIEPLFFKYKVDFSFEGHQHIYQRYYPIGPGNIYETQSAAKYVNPQYPIHVLSGAGGMKSTPAKRGDNVKRVSPHIAYQNSGGTAQDPANPSFTMVKFHNASTIELWQVTPNQAAFLDHWFVVKDNTGPWTHTATFTVTSTGSATCQ